MGIRYEKDTILNWLNEMGKFLRLLVDKWEDRITDLAIDPAYEEFFRKDKSLLTAMEEDDLTSYISTLDPEQVRPLALLFMYDGLINEDKDLIRMAKLVFDYHMKSSGSFSFEDYGVLARIDQELKN